MGLWVEKAKQDIVCSKCGEVISEGELVGRVKIKKDQFSLHPSCWEDGNAQPGRPGRKALPLTDEERKQRNLLLNKHSSIVWRLEREPDETKQAVMKESLNIIAREIANYGGAPKSWNNSSGEQVEEVL